MGYVVLIGAVYIAIGIVLARGLVRDAVALLVPEAEGATRGFRWIITPGVVLLWPLVRGRARAVEPAGNPRGDGVDPVDEEAG